MTFNTDVVAKPYSKSLTYIGISNPLNNTMK